MIATPELTKHHIAILREMARGDGTLPVDTLRGMSWNIIPDLVCAGCIVQRTPQWAGGSHWCITELGRKEARKV